MRAVTKTVSTRRRIAGCLLAILLILATTELGAKIVLVSVLGIRRANYNEYYLSNETLTLLTWSFKYSPHPYFGYESAPIRSFERERERRSKEDYVIAVLGGSVAEMFANYAISHLEHFEPLRSALPELAGKRIVIANLAIGGGHQPQQYFIASFFLEDVDLFINIEGFNEAEIRSAMPQYPLEYPSAVRTAYERTSGGRVYRWTASALIGVYQALNWLPVEFPILARSSAYFSLWYFGGRAVFAEVQWLQQRYFEAQLAPGNPPEAQLSLDELLERKVRMWRRYAVLQSRMIRRHRGKARVRISAAQSIYRRLKRILGARKNNGTRRGPIWSCCQVHAAFQR